MTETLIRQMMLAGLSRNQATSKTAETIIEMFMQEDGKVLIAEAKRQVEEMQKMVRDLREQYDSLTRMLQDTCKTVSALAEAQEEYGSVSEEKAKNAIALYGAILSMNKKYGASDDNIVENASYFMYAYLGGQAKREIIYTEPTKEQKFTR